MKDNLKKLVHGSGVKYIISSVAAFVVDNGLYNILFAALGAKRSLTAQIIARIISSLCQCNLNYFWVFGKNGDYLRSLIKYYCLCIPQTFVSSVLLTTFVSRLEISNALYATGIKIVIEAILFVISYFIQKYWVFKKNK